jgi:hypothetical protein
MSKGTMRWWFEDYEIVESIDLITELTATTLETQGRYEIMKVVR